MRLTTASMLLIISMTFAACANNRAGNSEQRGGDSTASSAPANSYDNDAKTSAERPGNSSAQLKTVSLEEANKSQTATAAVERKIIRNADISLEVSNPSESQGKIASFAESHGGFVVISEASQRQNNDRTHPEMTVKVVVRVPAAQFDATVTEIKGVASRIIQDKVTGQDVTEEFIDLEARIRTKKALEMQFLEIMKQAKSVSDALQVQNELGEVRTQIEQLEGRRRFLENQSSLSTITVTLQSPTPLVTTTGFFHSIKEAFGQGVDLAAEITLVLIRVIVTLLPILIFFGLPTALLVRYLIRRSRRYQTDKEVTPDEPTSSSNPV